MLAHAGLSISLSSIHRAVKSLSDHAAEKIKGAVRSLKTAFAYDNFDIDFKTAEPTVEHQSTFVSATSATAIPLFGVENIEPLRCSETLWNRDPRNPSLSALPNEVDAKHMLKIHRRHTFTKRAPGETLSPLDKNFAWHIRDILVHRGEFFGVFLAQLGSPDVVDQIPVHKTEQIPCRSMRIKESTTDGNIEVMDNLQKQGGIGEPDDTHFTAEEDIDMSEYVIIFHGDLLTKERQDSVKDSRRIEGTPKRRFQYIIFLPGLFHYKMACADAIWRIWVEPKEGRKDTNTMFQHIGILRPTETGKYGTKPGFRRMHDAVHHDLWASMLDCWRMEAKNRNSAWTSLKKFAESKPTWELIVEMSECIVRNYVARSPDLAKQRKRPMAERDQRFENQILRNRDELLYVELCHAMNSGDVGRVEGGVLEWVYIFKATGKHKYATEMLQFTEKLNGDMYSEELK